MEEVPRVPRRSLLQRGVVLLGALLGARLMGGSPAEAAIVGLLWAAWENGTPWVSQAWLLEQAGCDSKRIQDVFRRGRKAIGPMIVLSDGVACLRPPVQIMAA